MNIEHTTLAETRKQGFFLAPPLKRKAPQDCFRSYIDQIQDGFYSSSKLVKNEPRKTSDSYFIVKTFKDSVRSFRRNYSHRNVALFRTKRDGSTRGNIAYLTCSFLEMDGSTDGTIKSLEDVLTLVRKNNLLEGLQPIGTSKGNFHLLWTYNDPLPWTERNESYWTAQQKRLIKLFEQGGFNVDSGASLNPCQNLRNPSQLHPYNFKRRCEVFIHKSYQKTSLRAIYKALNETTIANPKRVQANTKLRRYSRANKTFITTHKELAIDLNLSPRTVKREIKEAIANGDLRIVARLGNNSEKTRTTQYESLIFIEQFPEVPLSISNINSLPTEDLLRDFKQSGTQVGRRQKTIFALGLFLKHKLGKTASLEAIRAALEGGAMRCRVPVREFERTLQNVMKPVYDHPFSLAKMRQWDLIVETKHFH